MMAIREDRMRKAIESYENKVAELTSEHLEQRELRVPDVPGAKKKLHKRRQQRHDEFLQAKAMLDLLRGVRERQA